MHPLENKKEEFCQEMYNMDYPLLMEMYKEYVDDIVYVLDK
jgi:hypothetical protein